VYLERALPENITIEMGMAMYDLSRYKEVLECSSGEEFAQRIREQSFSKEFLSAYNSFMDNYGARCPRELDVATPRLYEQPAAFFEQLQTMALNTDDALNPHTIFSTSKKEREETYEEFLKRAQKKGWLASKLFQWFYHILVAFGGYREIHKYYMIMGLDVFRRRVLAVAYALVEEGRLDNVDHVFDLTINDIDNAKDPSLDLRLLAEKNTAFLKKIKHIRDFPRAIDSRGKIFHPPQRAIAENEVVGQPISPGIVRGPVKVLHTPDEKPVLPGDILVARATDPGWTPLFINAGGIILEVGGLLQHGALVAREYGKPCIAGIENVTSLFTDGQPIEMDGLTGIIQILK
jgi:pyruvate,water dikinase